MSTPGFLRGPAAARLQILVAALLFSTGGAAIKATSLSAWQVAGFRSGVAATVLLLLLPAARRDWTWRSWVVGAAYAATMILFVLGNKLTTAAHTIFLQSTAPLYVLLIGHWLLGERVARRDLGFVLLVGLGLVALLGGSPARQATAPDPSAGNIAALFSGCCWALTIVGLRWLGRGGGESSQRQALAAVVAGNALAFFACLPWTLPLSNARAFDWASVVYLGVFQIGLAYLFFTRGLRHTRAFETSLLILLEPALNPVWAWLAHGELPGATAVLGGGVIVAATGVKSWLEINNRAPRSQRSGGAAGAA